MVRWQTVEPLGILLEVGVSLELSLVFFQSHLVEVRLVSVLGHLSLPSVFFNMVGSFALGRSLSAIEMSCISLEVTALTFNVLVLVAVEVGRILFESASRCVDFGGLVHGSGVGGDFDTRSIFDSVESICVLLEDRTSRGDFAGFPVEVSGVLFVNFGVHIRWLHIGLHILELIPDRVARVHSLSRGILISSKELGCIVMVHAGGFGLFNAKESLRVGLKRGILFNVFGHFA